MADNEKVTLEVDPSILEMVKDSLHMSCTLDDSSARRLNAEIASGIAYIQKYGDPDATCEPGTQSGELLCAYVLRAESGATETFGVDYKDDLLAMKAEDQVAEFAAAMGYLDEGSNDD